MIYLTGDSLEGEWSEDLPHGEEELVITCIVLVVMPVFVGKGKFSSPASEYEGDFAKGEFSGSGTLKQCDGSVYTGSFSKVGGRRFCVCRCSEMVVQGLFHGHGELKDVSGSVYSGEWKEGLRHGHGRLSSAVGVYEGAWKADRQVQGAFLPWLLGFFR